MGIASHSEIWGQNSFRQQRMARKKRPQKKNKLSCFNKAGGGGGVEKACGRRSEGIGELGEVVGNQLI